MAALKVSLYLLMFLLEFGENSPVYRTNNPQSESSSGLVVSSSLQSSLSHSPRHHGGPTEHETLLRDFLRDQNKQVIVSSQNRERESSEQEAEIKSVQLSPPTASSYSEFGHTSPVLHPDGSVSYVQTATKMNSMDTYEKLLESFIRGFMSRILDAEIHEFRVQKMTDRRKPEEMSVYQA